MRSKPIRAEKRPATRLPVMNAADTRMNHRPYSVALRPNTFIMKYGAPAMNAKNTEMPNVLCST